ncbi:hypothetical protein LCGC14_2084810 [marine sediment metagenome]|uniref:Uncharacterized protein n=1 Tax=marine sediment metagenome TaxID=412755 RepID=A0A0F9EED0_9ZZZZ
MIVIRVEMWPFGSKSNSRTLATAKITNMMTSASANLGNYKVELTLANENKIWRKIEVKGFRRKSYNIWYLLKLILNELI